MAELKGRVSLCVDDLEQMMGALQLPAVVEAAERDFFRRADEIAVDIAGQSRIRAVFISGPTASGKTTFTARLVSKLTELGREAFCLSLDNYYDVRFPEFDEKGRPDYESLSTLDLAHIARDIRDLLAGQPVHLSEFDFGETGLRSISDTQYTLPPDAILLVEGLHGLATEISGNVPRENRAGIFLLPWGGVVSDARLLESREIRLLRRIVRDVRHRSSGALSTIDYWPMIVLSEQSCFSRYLKNADYYMNTMLPYESLVMAPIALADIRSDLLAYREGRLPPSVFLRPHATVDKDFADIKRALEYAETLAKNIAIIPAADATIVPARSILNEFI